MTKIPDEVVETLWRDLCEKSDRTSPAGYPDMALITLDELRAAGEVFAAWEREQCETLAETSKGYPTAVSKAIRARGASEKE